MRERVRTLPGWLVVVACVMLVACAGAGEPRPAPLRAVGRGELRAPADFASIGDEAARSRALFVEAARALTHPRCINCHPSGDVPHQRMTLELHDPPVLRGPRDHGVVGMECTSCHQDRNQPHTRVPA